MSATIKSTNRIPDLIKVLGKLGKREIKVGVFGGEHKSEDGSVNMVTLARVHEYGMTIKPKNGKFLAIPTQHAQGKRPRDIPGLRFIPTQRGGLLVRETAGKHARSEIVFVLVRSVTIPERSFLRTGFDKNLGAITAKIKRMTNDVIRFKINPDVFLDMIGLEFAGMIQMELRDLSSPPNAPITAANKKSANPLIDTGRLVDAIRHEVK